MSHAVKCICRRTCHTHANFTYCTFFAATCEKSLAAITVWKPLCCVCFTKLVSYTNLNYSSFKPASYGSHGLLLQRIKCSRLALQASIPGGCTTRLNSKINFRAWHAPQACRLHHLQPNIFLWSAESITETLESASCRTISAKMEYVAGG